MIERKDENGMNFPVMLLLLMLSNIPFGKGEQQKQNESEVGQMTMEEAKEKLLDKIDTLLEGADAEDVRKLAEAYSMLNKDVLLEQLAKNGVLGGATKDDKQ